MMAPESRPNMIRLTDPEKALACQREMAQIAHVDESKSNANVGTLSPASQPPQPVPPLMDQSNQKTSRSV